eukprot:scaffold182653_cov33-Tisochrysis_lutea.AAC.5
METTRRAPVLRAAWARLAVRSRRPYALLVRDELNELERRLALLSASHLCLRLADAGGRTSPRNSPW